jgi:hypothetical protein
MVCLDFVLYRHHSMGFDVSRGARRLQLLRIPTGEAYRDGSLDCMSMITIVTE